MVEKQDGYEVIRQSDIFRHEDIQAVVSDPMDITFIKEWLLGH